MNFFPPVTCYPEPYSIQGTSIFDTFNRPWDHVLMFLPARYSLIVSELHLHIHSYCIKHALLLPLESYLCTMEYNNAGSTVSLDPPHLSAKLTFASHLCEWINSLTACLLSLKHLCKPACHFALFSATNSSKLGIKFFNRCV